MPGDELTPPVDETRIPPMHEMDWQRLERLTVDLFNYEPGITTSDDYGIPGQTDHGADVIARRDDGEEVASCKNREEIEAKDLTKWSNDFLKHWDDNWKNRNIKRFVLATTAKNTGERKVQNQVTAERERFKKLGVTYELWGPKQFVHKLRPHRALASRYFSETWAEIICGTASEFGVRAGTSSLVSAAAIAQMSELQENLSGQVGKRAEQALTDLRAGRIAAVRGLLEELREERTWSQLVPATQAEILRLAAAVALRDNDLERAAALDTEAEALSPAEEARIQAQIALECDGVDAAIQRLGQAKSLAGKRLLASLLVMKRDLTALHLLISELVDNDPEDAETLRLSALYELLRGDRRTALEQIKRAEVKAADWRAILQAGMIIRYALSLSPAVPADWFLYPNPLDVALVRGGEDVQAFLDEALSLLDRLESTDEMPEFLIWRLAILANRRNGHAEASALAAEILVKQPGEPNTVAWCVIRRLDVDLSPSTAALAEDYVAGTDLFRVRVLGLLLASTLEAGEAAARLRAHLDVQGPESQAEADLWIRRLEEPETSVADADDWLPGALRRAYETGSWTDAPDLLRRAFSTRPPHPSAIVLVQALADVGRWELLEDWIQNILEIETPAAIRVASFAASRLGDPARALAIIDENTASFGETLPPDLRRLRADALLKVGQVTAALREADQIVATTALPEDRLFRAEILVNIGDLRSGAGAVREALRENRLPPDRALKWAYLLHAENPDLARQLWRKAVSGGLAEHLAVAAIDQAFRLGLDEEAGPLMPLLQARAASGAPEVRMLDIDEIMEALAQQRESAEAIENLYLNGAIPAHLHGQGRLGAFVHLYMGRSSRDAGQLLVRLIRHGSRPRSFDFGFWRDWEIHIDVTGFLEAGRAGLLDALEHHPNPIRVSPRLPILLVEMQKAMRTAQPSVMDTKRRLLNGLQGRLICERDAPPEGGITIGMTDEDDQRGLASLIGGLRMVGYLSPAVAEERLKVLGGSAPAEDLILEPGMALHFNMFALEKVTAAGLLETLMGSFAVSVEAGFAEQASRALAVEEEERRLADALGALRERLSHGIQSGRYQLLEARHGEKGGEENLLLGCLGDILDAPAIHNGVAWIDDRLLTSYLRTNGMPIIGIVDALHAMHGAGTIDDAELGSRIADLRQSGALFIPFEPKEVSAGLLQAPVVAGRVVESDLLRILRRSLAAASKIERHLKLGEAEGILSDRPDEMEYLRSVVRLLADVLERTWTTAGQTEADLFARSDWIWANLRYTQTNRDVPAAEPEAAQHALEAMQIAHCLDKAIEIGGVLDERRELRLAFLHWVWERIVRPRSDADPDFVYRLAEYLSRFYAALLQSHKGRRQARNDRILQQLFIVRVDRLPGPLRELVAVTPEFSAFFRSVQRVTIGRSRFEASVFWRAIRAALRYGKSRLRRVDGRRVRMRRDGEDIVLSGAEKARLHGPITNAVAATPRELSAALDKVIRTYDVDDDAANALHSADLARAQPHVLAARLQEERNRSFTYKFTELEHSLRRRRSFHRKIIEPGQIQTFLTYLGMAADAPELQGAFATLSGRHEPIEAFRRLSGIPAAPAGNFDLGADDVEALATIARTPNELVHAAAVARRYRREDLTLKLVDRLVGTIADYGDLFVTILRWTEQAFHRDDGWRALSPSLRLATIWAYANRLIAILISTGSSPDHAKAFFDENPLPLSAPELVGMQSYALDQASPKTLSAPVLLYHGLGAVFGNDPVQARLPEELAQRAREVLIVHTETLRMPDLMLILRRSENPDAMGSFMGAVPIGLLPDELDPVATRRALVEGGLNSLEAGDAEAVAAWVQLGAIASGGLSSEERQRYIALLRQTDLWTFGFDGQQPNFVRWRVLIAPAAAADANWAADKLTELAGACRRNLQHGHGELASAALAELVETAAIVAAAFQTLGESTSFEDLLRRIVFAWPECAPMLRNVVNNLLGHTPAGRSKRLWDLYLLLRTFQ